MAIGEMLPGPALTQMGGYNSGDLRAGKWGMLATGLCFIARTSLMAICLA